MSQDRVSGAAAFVRMLREQLENQDAANRWHLVGAVLLVVLAVGLGAHVWFVLDEGPTWILIELTVCLVALAAAAYPISRAVRGRSRRISLRHLIEQFAAFDFLSSKDQEFLMQVMNGFLQASLAS